MRHSPQPITTRSPHLPRPRPVTLLESSSGRQTQCEWLTSALSNRGRAALWGLLRVGTASRGLGQARPGSLLVVFVIPESSLKRVTSQPAASWWGIYPYLVATHTTSPPSRPRTALCCPPAPFPQGEGSRATPPSAATLLRKQEASCSLYARGQSERNCRSERGWLKQCLTLFRLNLAGWQLSPPPAPQPVALDTPPCFRLWAPRWATAPQEGTSLSPLEAAERLGALLLPVAAWWPFLKRLQIFVCCANVRCRHAYI